MNIFKIPIFFSFR